MSLIIEILKTVVVSSLGKIPKGIAAILQWTLEKVVYRKLRKYIEKADSPPYLYGKHLFTYPVSLSQEKIENLIKWGKPAIKYLIEDQLLNGFWSKVDNWARIASHDPISIAGASTATFFAIEALIYGNYENISSLPRKNHLLETINQVTDNSSGQFIKYKKKKAAGGLDKVFESIAHSSADFIIRQMFIQTIEEVDKKIIKNLTDKVTARKINEVIKFDSIFLIKALLIYGYHKKGFNGKQLKFIDYIFKIKYYQYLRRLESCAKMFIPEDESTSQKDRYQWINLYVLIPVLDIYIKLKHRYSKLIFNKIVKLLFVSPVLASPSSNNPSIYSLCIRLIVTLYVLDKINDVGLSFENLSLKSRINELRDQVSQIVEILLKKDLVKESLIFEEKYIEQNLCINFQAVTLLLNIIGYQPDLTIKPSKSDISKKYEEAIKSVQSG